MNSNRNDTISICQECGGADDVLMVQCDNCDKWSHFSCVGVRQEIEDYEWLCNRCNFITLGLLLVDSILNISSLLKK